MRMDISSLFAVGCGAFLGAVLRWVLGMWLNPMFPTLPLGTLGANLLGGLLMGMAMGVFSQFDAFSPAARLFFTTGFLGGLTTFSTFSAETVTKRFEYFDTSQLRSSFGPLIFVLSNVDVAPSIGCPSSSVRCSAMPSKFSSANPIGSISRWHCEQS